MKKSLNIDYQIFSDISQLDETDRRLLEMARSALDKAYAPYSGFQVAAALMLDNGIQIVGTNQENASYGLCLCAEQNILATAGSEHFHSAVKVMAITARSLNKPVDHPISPCGACRQVLSEHEDRHQQPIRLLLQGETGEILCFASAKDLLPFSFSAKDLL
ncbi:MAG: cytidine deaminase [Saprospiraceae bacterium]|nr:cytidine deaminase [Saprospiraceae bacterium]